MNRVQKKGTRERGAEKKKKEQILENPHRKKKNFLFKRG